MKTLQIRVYGQVQGVGFRYFAHRKASDFSVKGWVRNCNDGSVEVCAQGEEPKLQQFVKVLEKGPAFASVARLAVEEMAGDKHYKDFHVEF